MIFLAVGIFFGLTCIISRYFPFEVMRNRLSAFPCGTLTPLKVEHCLQEQRSSLNGLIHASQLGDDSYKKSSPSTTTCLRKNVYSLEFLRSLFFFSFLGWEAQWEKKRCRETQRESSCTMLRSDNGQGWPGAQVVAGCQSRSLMWVAEVQWLEHHPLPAWMYINRKLELGSQSLGLKPGILTQCVGGPTGALTAMQIFTPGLMNFDLWIFETPNVFSAVKMPVYWHMSIHCPLHMPFIWLWILAALGPLVFPNSEAKHSLQYWWKAIKSWSLVLLNTVDVVFINC